MDIIKATKEVRKNTLENCIFAVENLYSILSKSGNLDIETYKKELLKTFDTMLEMEV